MSHEHYKRWYLGIIGNWANLKDLGFGTSDTLLSSLDEDLIRFQRLTASTLGILRVIRITRESDLDGILLFETNDILATLCNENNQEPA